MVDKKNDSSGALRNISRIIFQVFITGVACVTTTLARSPDPIDALRTCAKTADRDTRIECYELLGQQVLDEEAEAAQPGQATVGGATGTPVLKDDLGGKQFTREAAPVDDVNRGLITSCSKGATDRWYFYFENGQIWKQVKVAHLYLDDCKRIATITKDMFGYKMEIEGRKGKIRISRIK